MKSEKLHPVAFVLRSMTTRTRVREEEWKAIDRKEDVALWTTWLR